MLAETGRIYNLSPFDYFAAPANDVRDCSVWTELLGRRDQTKRANKRHEQEQRSAASYSMTSSARIRADCGIVSPSAFAAFRLITTSKLTGCSIGRRSPLAFVGLSTKCARLADIPNRDLFHRRASHGLLMLACGKRTRWRMDCGASRLDPKARRIAQSAIAEIMAWERIIRRY